MTISTLEASDSLTHVALIGALDVAGIREIEAPFLALTAGRKASTIVDLSDVSFIASFGMRMLIASYKLLSQENHKMILLNPSPDVAKVLECAGFTDVMPVVATEAEARQLLQEPANQKPR